MYTQGSGRMTCPTCRSAFHSNEIAHVDGRAPKAAADGGEAAAADDEDGASLSISGSYGTKVRATSCACLPQSSKQWSRVSGFTFRFLLDSIAY